MGRKDVIINIGKTNPNINTTYKSSIDIFACRVFNLEVMEKNAS